MINVELKPCPYCGAEPKMEHINFATIKHDGNCILKGIRRLWRETTEYNFKNWNTRTTITVEEVADLIDKWELEEFGHYECDCVPANKEQVNKLAQAIINKMGGDKG